VLQKLEFKVDYLGAFVSFLCLIHCLSTPLIFVAKACSVSCCVNAPVWWKLVDYFFIVISFTTIYFGTRTSTKKRIKQALWFAWSILLITVANESIGFIHLPEYTTYIPAILLICLHLYSQKYCKCSSNACCTNPV
jgi:hypothetical protein